MPKHQAYVILYEKISAEDQYKIYVGKKQVNNYKVFVYEDYDVNIRDWNKVKAAIRDKKPVLNAQGKMIDASGRVLHAIGKRFLGFLAPAGGRSCFLGGGNKGNETPPETAVRELKEELNLAPDVSIPPGLLRLEKEYTYSNDGWSGFYYSLNVDECPGLRGALNIPQENIRIAEIERTADLFTIYQNQPPIPDPERYFPEMHQITIVAAANLLMHLNDFDESYIRQELQKFCQFFLQVSGIKDDTIYNAMLENLMTHWRNHEAIDGNVEAARLLIERLSMPSVPNQNLLLGTNP